MTAFALVVALLLLGLLACLQLLVAFGLPLGRFVWGGAHRVLSPRLRIASALSIGLYCAFSMLLLSRVGVIPGENNGVIIVSTWLLFAYFSLGVLMNSLSRSPAERWTMAPTCVLLAVSTFVIALN